MRFYSGHTGEARQVRITWCYFAGNAIALNMGLPRNEAEFMKPYYEDKWGVIYLGDCLEILPELDKQSVNIIITDPPYSCGVNSSGKKADYGDNSLIKPFMREVGRNLFRLITINGAIYINTDWRTYPVWWDVFTQIKPLTNLIVWDYGWIKAGSHYRFTHEFIMFWAMGNHKITDHSTADVWRIPPINFTTEKLNPAEKPVELINEILRNSSGETILDPFLGSGTTAVAAKKLNRHYIGIEISEKYCEIAARRLSQDVMVLDIPEPPPKKYVSPYGPEIEPLLSQWVFSDGTPFTLDDGQK